MTKLIAGIIFAVVTALGWYLKWRLSPERKVKMERRRKQPAYDANAAKKGRKLGRTMRDLWR